MSTLGALKLVIIVIMYCQYDKQTNILDKISVSIPVTILYKTNNKKYIKVYINHIIYKIYKVKRQKYIIYIVLC